MADINIQTLLSEMHRLAAIASGSAASVTQPSQPADFAALLKGAVEQVNQAQHKAADMARAFEIGDDSVDLAATMIELQKARISFEALVQVRNKVVQAYQDIMNMPL